MLCNYIHTYVFKNGTILIKCFFKVQYHSAFSKVVSGSKGALFSNLLRSRGRKPGVAQTSCGELGEYIKSPKFCRKRLNDNSSKECAYQNAATFALLLSPRENPLRPPSSVTARVSVSSEGYPSNNYKYLQIHFCKLQWLKYCP